jgi:HlyD family secretion protein
VALQAQGFVSTAKVDDARTAAAQAAARVAELTAALDAARLPARPEARRAADAQAQAAAAVLAGSQWRLAQTQARSPQAAQVADTYYREGEWVAAGQPVLSLLPDGRVKARFFVPEAEIASVAPGLAVTLHCDGCGPPIPARVSVIATEPEFTPPVIYSNAERARLVFRVEARPSPADGVRLRPGQPLDVRRVP